MDIVGLIPAAGRGSRLAPLPCSKEVLPLGTRAMPDGSIRPKALVHYLLEAYQASGIDRAVLVTGASKWDVPAFITSSGSCGVNVCCVGLGASPGTPFSLDHAYPWVRGSLCALGFPDILLPVESPFRVLVDALSEVGADVALGLFPAEDPTSVDVVEVDSAGWVTSLIPKPERADPPCLTWSVAVWRPGFTDFMHQLLEPAWTSERARALLMSNPAGREVFVGHVFNRARSAGLRVYGTVLSDQPSLDVGTVASFNRAAMLGGAANAYRICQAAH